MPNSVVKSFSKKYNLSVSEVERHWQTAKAAASETLPPKQSRFLRSRSKHFKEDLEGKTGEAGRGIYD